MRPDADRVEARKVERVAVKALDEHIKTQPLGTRAGSLRATEASIAARLDALKRSRGSGEELAELIQEELARTPARERSKLLGYFERWCDRQFEILLEESSPATRMIQ
jgi:hypothetical protein